MTLTQNTEFSKFLEELKAKSNIVSVVNKYVPLEQKGRTYWGRCPFHGEKTPSFAVNEADGFYHCFGCKAGGDVIKFIEEIESVDFNDAVAILAEQAHLEVPAFKSTENKEDISERKKYKDRLLEVTRETAKYYTNNLFEGKCPKAMAYLEKRKVDRDMAVKFGLGASIGFSELVVYLKSKGFTEKEMLDAGVVKSKDNRYFDTVAGRLVFPIIDVMGNVIGFCGRILETADFAKYLNTAETQLFSKGKTLYGINLIKKKKQENSLAAIKFMIIVEGQMDVVSLHKAGFDMAVASMGTALTSDQSKLIKRFCDNVIICYDGDFAGKKATLRGLDILKEDGLNIKIMNLPEGMDPDDVIVKLGRDGFLKLMKEAMPLLDFKLEIIKKDCNLQTREGRAKYVEKALEVLREVPSEVEREVYLSLVSEVSNTNKDFLKRQLGGEVALAVASKEEAPKAVKREKVEILDNVVVKAQKFVLSCMLHLKPFAYFKNSIDYIFSGEEYAEICRAIESARGSINVKQVIDRAKSYLCGRFDEDLNEVINYLLAYGTDDSESKYFKDCLWIIYKNYLNKKLEDINKQLIEENDLTKRKEMLAQIADIVSKIRLKKVEL